MKQQRTRLFLLTALAIMTNGFSLLGFGHGSVGAVAKNIESNHNIGRGILTERTLKSLSGNPPAERDYQLPAVFDMSSLVCCSDHLA
ncbi:hypothetical protein [Pseudomonas sp. BN102]|uniref:hypothetical protein n=1 Tax=Pseudomonas sp. BN102 TaxID=2567886 RepID=UPI002453E79B|nr:hypothetical protein [Pseudomonas sp. BN102]MDH4608657.1 hypothetical protein [Pseudomonas sp. BN102]